MAFRLLINAFPDGGEIPVLHTCDGADVSPSLEWSGPPEGAQSFALIVEDPDAPAGTWNHWLLYDIPPTLNAMAQGFKSGTLGVSGANDFRRRGYGGPCPPKGHGQHRYFFRLLALDVPKLGLPEGARRPEVEAAIKGHVLGEAQYMGRYARK